MDFLSMLTKWIENAKVIPEKENFEKLGEVRLSKLSKELALFIRTVTNKSSDKSNLAKFVSMIIEETFPPRFAYWAIDLVFSVIHNKPGKIQDVCAVLVRHLQNPEKCRNALFMIE
jgi:hypothetical protein